MANNEEKYARMREKVCSAERILIGIGGEWGIEGSLKEEKNQRVRQAYGELYALVKDKDYFIVTTLTDGAIYDTALLKERFVAPCGNVHWRQCGKGCTTDIWEEGEVKGDVCPHCGGPLVENTIQSECYIEEGYLSQWKKYQLWLSTTLNKELVVLELGVGFKTPTVIRWPFEKTVFFNKKAWLFRVHQELFQTSEEIKEKSTPIAKDSVEFLIVHPGKL